MKPRSFTLNTMMWFLAAMFYAYQYILRVLPNIMMPDLMQKFQIEASQFGQLSGIYYIGYAGMHIPIGIFLDRFGPKIVLPICMALAALGLLPFIYAENWAMPCLGRFLIGVSSSAAILGVFKIIRIAYKEAHFTRMLGVAVTIGLLGAIYGGWPVRWLINHVGWQMTFMTLIYTGLAMAALTYVIVPKIEVTEKTSVFSSVKQIFSNAKILMICILAGFMVGPLEGFADGWSAVFLERMYQVSQDVASSLPSMIFIGMCVGSPLLSLLAEKTRAYFELIAISALVMALGFVLLITGFLNVNLISLVFFVVGILCAYQILAIYKASTYARSNEVGLTTAVANMIIMLFGYVFHSVIGKMTVFFWKGEMLEGIPYYDGPTLSYALAFIPFMLAVAGIGFMIFAIRERKNPA